MSQPPDERTKFPKRVFIFGLLPGLLLLLGWFAAITMRREARPMIEILPFPAIQTPNMVSAYFQDWGWRIKRFILPNQRVIDIQGVLFATTNGTGLRIPSTLFSTNVFMETNGIRIVLLPKTELQWISHRLEADLAGEILARPRIVTADGVRGGMFVGSSVLVQGISRNVGLDLSVYTLLRKSVTELSFTLVSADAVANSPSNSKGDQSDPVSIRTNLAVVARIQLPAGMGVLLMSKPNSSVGQRETTVILELETLKR
jgi:hypothetical protein